MELFSGSMKALEWLKKDVVIGVIVFSLIMIILIIAGFCIFVKGPSNWKMGIYGAFLFSCAFIPLLG